MELPDIINQGISIAIAGYIIVFLALVLLYFVFTFLSKGLLFKTKRRLAKSGKIVPDNQELHISGEVTAAIAMAIYLSRDLHDVESGVLTIKRISKTYSPWNSRIYGMRNYRR